MDRSVERYVYFLWIPNLVLDSNRINYLSGQERQIWQQNDIFVSLRPEILTVFTEISVPLRQVSKKLRRFEIFLGAEQGQVRWERGHYYRRKGRTESSLEDTCITKDVWVTLYTRYLYNEYQKP